MSNTIAFITTSADGFVAGPRQSIDHPLGEGADGIHDWAFKLARVPRAPRRGGRRGRAQQRRLRGGVARASAPRSWAATCSAAAPGRGATNHGTAGGATTRPSTCRSSSSPTTSASPSPWRRHDLHVRHRRDRVGARAGPGGRRGKDVLIAGGADAINQYLAAGLVDELEVNVVPLDPRRGARLLDGVGPDVKLEQTAVVEGSGVTHVRYAVVDDPGNP